MSYNQSWSEQREQENSRLEQKIEVLVNEMQNRFKLFKNLECVWCSTDLKEYVVTAKLDNTTVFIKTTPNMHRVWEKVMVPGTNSWKQRFFWHDQQTYEEGWLRARRFLPSVWMDEFFFINEDFTEAIVIPLWNDGDGVDPFGIECIYENLEMLGFKNRCRLSEITSPMFYEMLSDLVVSYTVDRNYNTYPVMWRIDKLYSWDCDIVECDAFERSDSIIVSASECMGALVSQAFDHIGTGSPYACVKVGNQYYMLYMDIHVSCVDRSHAAPIALGILGLYDKEFSNGEMTHNYDKFVRSEARSWSIIMSEPNPELKQKYISYINGTTEQSSGDAGVDGLMSAFDAFND